MFPPGRARLATTRPNGVTIKRHNDRNLSGGFLGGTGCRRTIRDEDV